MIPIIDVFQLFGGKLLPLAEINIKPRGVRNDDADSLGDSLRLREMYLFILPICFCCDKQGS